MAENDAIRDDYEDKYLGGGEDDVTERLADIDDETAEARAQALLEGLEDYDLDEEDRALLGAWGFELDEEEEQLADPVVAIVGRPNVGKSTIINRILGRREAVVEDKPGVTRDRVSYKAEWLDKRFTLGNLMLAVLTPRWRIRRKSQLSRPTLLFLWWMRAWVLPPRMSRLCACSGA